ncbi:MAG: hypothetical protein KAI80_10755 [Hyphomicrobiaceae bacterium]|nr:hypothetical protein [Hyphomicrobiaceae bacterium]
MALWGERWAAVATLARHEQAAGEAYMFLKRLRDEAMSLGVLCREDEIDTMPEDVLQILALGEGL